MLIFIDNDKEAVVNERNMFYRMRLHTVCLGTKDISAIGNYPAQAIFIPRPASIPRLEDICYEIRCHFPSLPIGALYREGEGNYYTHLRACDIVFDDERVSTTEVVERLFALYKERTNRSPFDLHIGDVRTRLKSSRLYVFGYPVPVTAIQWRIVRYLHLAYPRTVPAKEILETCFSFRHPPAQNNVSTQICLLNKKIKSEFGFAPIVYRQKLGYCLSRAQN